MVSDSNVAPVIIKRKKVVGGDGHHGGAWKVAYADFVTAMMAFFMLMWLLNATTEKQRKGLADYFSPTIAVNRISGGGDGSFGGESVLSEQVLPQMGYGASSISSTDAQQARGQMGVQADGSKDAEATEQLFKIEEALMGRGGESYVAKEMFKHVITKVTDEGLVVELFDTEDAQLFDGNNRPTQLLNGLLDLIVEASELVENAVAVEGHVASSPIVIAQQTGWERSAGRAQIVRQQLANAGFAPERLQRLTGHADRELVASNPMNIRNNRIEVIFLKQDS